MIERVLINVRGVVQGVGFRPFVYKEAKNYGITGYVCNTSEGVLIDAQGLLLKNFTAALRENFPKHARIDSIEVVKVTKTNYINFEIRESITGEIGAVIPQDSALCSACLDEMYDPNNRRYHYPFINCTDCGPRYTIIQMPPYDRIRTSMKEFVMCGECAYEYTDPTSRRYHAEPISCPDCGPTLCFYDSQGDMVSGDPITLATSMLQAGRIVAIKGIGGFHLMCDATNDTAVKELRRKKQRKSKPLAVMFRSLEQAGEYGFIEAEESKLIEGAYKPIVIIKAKKTTNLSSFVAPNINRIGVFIPYTPLHHLLFDKLEFPLVATSANISDEPILTHRETLIYHLSGIIDGVLDHNREIINAIDDAVVQIADGNSVVLRMGRGYAPYSTPLSKSVKNSILAVGGHQKSAIAIANSRNLVLGGHIGDLGGVDADEYFEQTIHTFQRFYKSESKQILHDLHPNYTSTRYALAHDKEQCGVQHHYAHILACMAEYSLDEKVLGFAFDGTGYGEDGTLWGGEVMIADNNKFERIGFLKPFALIGGDKAIKEPRRVALSLLFEQYTLDEVLGLSSPVINAFGYHEIRQMHHIWNKKINTPYSSSMGRLFDAVSALGGFIQTLDYDGQGGLIMEDYVDESIIEPFEFSIYEREINISSMITQIVTLRANIGDTKEGKVIIASRFIATINAIMHHFAKMYPDLAVVVGGGVFQNRALLGQVYRSFATRRFYAQQRTPINDGSIALGQAWWGIHNTF